MANKEIELCELVYALLKYNPDWKGRDRVTIYSNSKVELEGTGEENEVVGEYKVNRAWLKKEVLKKL